MNVTYTYDGGGANWSDDGILVAHVRGGTPGEVYALDRVDGDGHYVLATADSNGDCDVTMDTIGGTVGLTFAYLLVRDSDYGTVSGCLIKIGTTGTQPNIAGTVTWNGTDTFQLTLDSPTNIQTYLFYWDSNGYSYSSDGSATVYTATLIGSLWRNKDYLVIQEYDPSTNTWFDSGLWWVATGDTTVFIPPFGAGPLTANFRGTPLFGVTPLTINFTDRSSAGPGGAITNWDWHFGDGGTSNVQNPSHVYNVPGIYAVSLTVTSPDGTDTKTLTNYIQVFAPSTNTDCASAFPLSPSGGTMTITNQFASDTPADQDPFGHIWPIGPGFGGYNYSTGPPYTWVPKQLSRQVWYKCTNTSSEKLFFRLVMQNFTGGLAACLYFGCPNPVMAYDPVGDHTVPIFEIPDTPQIWPPYGSVNNGGFLGVQGNNGFVTPAVTGDTLGIVLDPGQTVYIEFGGDDVYPYYSFPYGPGHGWNGTMDITWDFHSILQWRDGIDNFLSPDDTSMPDISQNDRSGTVPPHQELDPSGFDLTAYTTYEALATPTIDGPTAYGHFNNHHFVTAPRFKDLGDFYPDGSYRGAGWGNDQLGVWELDENGNQVNFWILFEGVHTTGLSLINSQAGNGITGNFPKFCTDGTNLWLVVVLYERVLNPYGWLYDSRAGWWGTWAPSHTVVFSYTGSGWTRIGAIEAATSNTLFFNNLVGGYGGNGYSFDACASPDEPGVLHVVTSEWGTQDGPGGVYTGIFEHGYSGTDPRQIRWQTSYGRFSPTGEILKTAIDEYNAAAGPVADASIGSHSSNPGYCWVRNDGGSPVYFRLKGIDQFGTQLPTDTFEMYDLSGATDRRGVTNFSPFVFDVSTNVASGNASSTTLNWPGGPDVGKMLVAIFAFEGVAPGSGPYISDTGSAGGWFRAFYQAPSATGCGIEVWYTYDWTSIPVIGSSTPFNFTGTYTYVGQGIVLGGVDGTIDPLRSHSSEQWTGASPQTPAIAATANDIVIGVSSEQLTSSAYGSPTPVGANQFDDRRGGVTGNVDLVASYLVVGTDGSYQFTWPSATAGSTAKGTTGILAFKPWAGGLGSSSVPSLGTITTTDLYSLFARNSPPIHTYDELLAGSLSENAPVDIASDGKRVWYLSFLARASTLPYYYNDDYPLLRIPVDRSSPFLYFENDIHKSFYYGIVGLQNWYVYCESKQTWMLGIYSTNIAQYIRCMNTWYQWPGWVTDRLGYIQVYPPGDIYPTLTQKGRGFAYNRDDFYYGAWFYKDAIGNPAYDGGFVGANLDAVGKSRILRDYFICQIDITPAVMRQSIFWFFKDGTWHNAGNDPNYNLWFYRNGMWRSHLADSQHALYGQLNSSWQN